MTDTCHTRLRTVRQIDMDFIPRLYFTGIQYLAFCALVIAVSLAPAGKALSEEQPDVREVGQRIGVLNANAMAVQWTGASSSEKVFPALDAIVANANIPGDPGTARRLVRFFFNGASWRISAGSPERSYVVFYNPVVDAALLTEWSVHETSGTLVASHLVPGEVLQGSTAKDALARWRLHPDAGVPKALTGLGGQFDESVKTKAFQWSLPELDAGRLTGQLDIAKWRLIAAAASTFNKDCDAAWKTYGGSFSKILKAATRTNIGFSPEAGDVLIPDGAYDIGDMFVRLETIREKDPGMFIEVVMDKSKGCSVSDVYAFSVF